MKRRRMNSRTDVQLRRQIDSLSKGKEGRKVIRAASRAALEVFNMETADNAAELNLKPSGKGWRKALKKKGNYKYSYNVTSGAAFTASTGINYKKNPILAVSHLVERGFNHFKAGRIAGEWYRYDAYEDNYKRIMSNMKNNLIWGWEQVVKTGRAPTASKMRKRAD